MTLDVTQKYDKDIFIKFLRDFLPDDFELKEEKFYFDSKILNSENSLLLGTSDILDLAIYEFCQISEKDPRVSITKETTSLMKRFCPKNNVLAVFYNKDASHWRFSLITSDVAISAKGNPTQKFSNPKRYSFLLGQGCKRHTPESMFFENGRVKKVSDLEDLKSRFSVESVTKEFYNKLFAWYEWALKNSYFPEDGDICEPKENKIIRLITRLIFVWFIKEKHLVPEKIFNKEKLNYILKDFDAQSESSSCYYNAILQNLFFATLNKEIKDDEGNVRKFANLEKRDLKTFYRYDEMFCLDENKDKNREKIIQLFSKIPFLNGGLFECLDKEEKTDKVKFHFDGFSRNSTKKNGKFTQRAFVPNNLFFNEENGIIPLFNMYNFTVEENTPSDIQVALDPELLGKVFENLLGAYNPETQESARKDSGSFYTPREIVEYMVNESIIQYLCNETEFLDKDKIVGYVNDTIIENAEKFSLDESKKIIQALYDIKVFDPACGSGAFPMGMLSKLESLIITLSEHCTKLVKDEASTNIDNSIIIKEGQSIYYEPDENLKIQCRYLGNFEFEVLKNKSIITPKIKVDDMTLLVKGEIEKYNHGEKHKKTIANIFSQGRIEDNTSFINIQQRKRIARIIDDKNNVLWEYKTYNTKNRKNSAEDAVYNIIHSAHTTDKNHYNLKLTLIQNCIYGSDIQPIAVQIAKLRFFISLICEQERDETQENLGINPLPNLETKIVCANSLISPAIRNFDSDWTANEKIMKKVTELREVRCNHFLPKSMSKKLQLRSLDEELCREITCLIKGTQSNVNEKFMKIKQEELRCLEKELEKVKEPYWIDATAPSPELFYNENKLFKVDANEKKRKALEKQISAIKDDIRREYDKNADKEFEEAVNELLTWQPYSQYRSCPFFDAEWMFGIKTGNVENKRSSTCNDATGGGFDIVIGNPPYGAKISELEKRYYKEHYDSTKTRNGIKGSCDTFVVFIELGHDLLKMNGNLAFIVPMSVTSSDAMGALHKKIKSDCGIIKVSSYAVRPKPVFENAVVDVSIIQMIKDGKANQKLYSTKMYRRTENFNLKYFVDHLQFVRVEDLCLIGRIPKISEEIERRILKKLFYHKRIADYKDENGRPIYYRTSGGRYFKVVTNYSTESTKEKAIFFKKEYCNIIGCFLSSNLSFWFYQIISNNHDWKSAEIESFPLPDFAKLQKTKVKELEILYSEYLTDIEKNANMRISSGSSSYNVATFKEYKIVKSKPIIDKIDDLICPLYGLTAEETDFIKNYELDARTSGAE